MTGTLNRRQFVKKLAVGATGGAALGLGLGYWLSREPASSVTILKAKSYTENLTDLIKRALQDYPAVIARARGKRVVLKPNLVEYYEARGVNTHPALVAAAIGAFRSVGAREVIVAEGPGHQRDTEMLIEQSGLDDALKAERTAFVDLNLDSTHPVPLRANYTRLGRLFFPDTILGADLVVSMPKLKTHHWVGATLSLKNMFGTVPGVKYGWPKNVLHWCGDQSIEKSIVDINVALQPGFAIVDGIEGMEGDGPLRGETVQSGVVIVGDNLTAVDATSARVMGLNAERLSYLQVMQRHGGTLSESRIEQLGEPVGAVRCNFKVLPPFAFLKLASAGCNMPQEENCGLHGRILS
ncbi:MAG: DUF362 domain-containing protein [Verrucomicrobia bacterium]|nr:DUF362 domain-containing protein [Verrucomicrobiota bacterium]